MGENKLQNNKHYIKLFGINTLKIKKTKPETYEVWLFFLPFLRIKTKKNKTRVNLLIFYLILDWFKKYSKKLRINISKKLISLKFKLGGKVKICLMTSRPGMWSYDYLYKILQHDPKFEPMVVVTPDPFQGKAVMNEYLQASLKILENKNIPAINGWDKSLDKPFNLRKKFNPDLILFSDFWKPHFCEEFYITNYPDKITMLNEYGFSVMQDEKTCNFELNNLVDIYFRPTEKHLEMAQKLMPNKGKNIKIVGHPKLDAMFDKNYIPQQVWKPQEKPKKRIIWAPHHSYKMPANMYCNNAFWEIYNFMFEVAEQYKDKIQFAFRPHQMLKPKVENEWGREKANAYYSRWNELENGQYFDGDFIDLFMESDAMIMDSCSFMAEYTAFDKLLFHTVTKTTRINMNDFGKELYKHCYKTETELKEDIIKFIENVVLDGNDYLAEGRHKFVQKYLGKVNGKMASENIYDEIVKYLEKGI